MTVCENCGSEIRENRKHQSDGDGQCQIIDSESEQVVGWTQRKYRDIYKRNNPSVKRTEHSAEKK